MTRDEAEARGLGGLGLLDDRVEQLLRRPIGEGVVGKVETEPDLAHATSMPPMPDAARMAGLAEVDVARAPAGTGRRPRPTPRSVHV